MYYVSCYYSAKTGTAIKIPVYMSEFPKASLDSCVWGWVLTPGTSPVSLWLCDVAPVFTILKCRLAINPGFHLGAIHLELSRFWWDQMMKEYSKSLRHRHRLTYFIAKENRKTTHARSHYHSSLEAIFPVCHQYNWIIILQSRIPRVWPFWGLTKRKREAKRGLM